MWKSGWGRRGNALSPSLTAFTNFYVGADAGENQWYTSTPLVDVGPFRFTDAGFYVGTVIDFQNVTVEESFGIAGHADGATTGGWLLTMGAGPALGFGAYGSDTTFYSCTALLPFGFTYSVLAQLYVNPDTNITTLELWIDGAFVDSATMPGGVTYRPVPGFANASRLLIGKVAPSSAVQSAGNTRIVGLTGGDFASGDFLAEPQIGPWSDEIRAEGRNIPLFGAPALNEDRFSAYGLTRGNAPDPYTSTISAELLAQRFAVGEIIQVVSFTPVWV